MKNLILSSVRLFIIALIPSAIYAQKPTIENIENSNLYEQAIVSTDDGGFIYASRSTSSYTNASTRIVRRDSDLNILWDTIYGGTGMERIFGIAKVQGGYVFSGTSTSTDGTLQGIPAGTSWFFKIDEQGEMVWQKRYDGAPYFRGIQQTKNGDLIVCGTATSESAYTRGWKGGSTTEWGATSPNGDGWIAKLNQDGDTLWTSRCIGGSGQEYLVNIIEDTVNGGFVATGMVKSEDGDLQSVSGTGAYWIVKVSDNGELEWQKRYGGSGSFEDPNTIRSTETGYIISGRSTSVDGDISSPKGGGSTDIWVIWIDRNGTLLQERSYGGTQQDGCQSMISTSDGGFLLLGQTGSSDGDVDDNPVTDYINCAWVVKINPQGVVEWTKFMYINGKGVALPHRGIQRNDGSFIIISSNWLAKLSPCPENISLTQKICAGATYNFNGKILSIAGEYKDTLSTVGGCDSIVTLTLEHLALPEQPVISQAEDRLSIHDNYTAYQWFFNGNLLENETSHSVGLGQEGQYSVSVSNENECQISSELFTYRVNDPFPLREKYVWNFTVPGMGNQFSDHVFYEDSIVYNMAGVVYSNAYTMIKDTYHAEQQRWVGIGKGGNVPTKDGVYFVLFFHELEENADSVLIYKAEFTSREDAYNFSRPDLDNEDNHGWNWYKKPVRVGLWSNVASAAFQVHPNPVQDALTVSYSGTDYEIHISNLTGQEMLTQQGNGATQVQTNNLEQGIYLLRVTENGQLKGVQKFVKQ